jgi:hypothetical protein
MVTTMTYTYLNRWTPCFALALALAGAGCGGDSGSTHGDSGTENGEETEGIDCGQFVCTGDEICCVTFGGAGSSTATCTTEANCQGATIECQDASHCDEGQQCCPSAGGSSCVPTGTCTAFTPSCEGPSDCDEAEDEVCCLTGSGTDCADSCEGGLLVCSTADDCPATSPHCCTLAGVGNICRQTPCPGAAGP